MNKVLEFCTLRQALNWVYSHLIPLPEHVEHMLRGPQQRIIPRYKEKPEHTEILHHLLSGEIRVLGTPGKITSLETIFDKFDFVPDDSPETNLQDILATTPLNYADWQHNCIYVLPHIEYAGCAPVHCEGLPTPALGNIQVCFEDLRRVFPAEPASEQMPDNSQLEYINGTIYINSGGVRQKYKTLRHGNQRTVFEYLFNHPDRIISAPEIVEHVSLSKPWTKEDSIQQIIINILPAPELRKHFFPRLSKHEAMFRN